MHQTDKIMFSITFFKLCDIFYFIWFWQVSFFSFSMAPSAPHTDQNINLLQEHRNFLLLIFNISSSFGSHGQCSKVIFPSLCSAFYSESDSEELGKASASAAAEVQAEIQPVLPSLVTALLPWKDRAGGETSQPQIWAEFDLPFNTGITTESNCK